MDLSNLHELLEPALGTLLPVRPPLRVPSWPPALQRPDALRIRELFERYWPLSGVQAYHSLWGLQRCIEDDDLPLLHSHGRTPIASGWSGDIICISIDSKLDVSIASHDLLYSSESKKGRGSEKVYCSLGVNIVEYLRRLARIEATVRFRDGTLQYSPSAEDIVHADFYDAVRDQRSKEQ